MAQFIIENEVLSKMDERDLVIVMGGEDGNELWIKAKDESTKDVEFVASFETKEIAYYIAKEIQGETGMEARVQGDFPPKEYQNMYLFKNDTQEALSIGEYVISFNNEPSNVLFRGYKTLEEVEKEIEKETPLKMYNDWLDWIGSDTIAEDIKEYYVGKVVHETKNMYIIDYRKVTV